MNLNKVDFNKIAVFCQVIDSGNYQRASETLLVTPSALSQTIVSLERDLAFPLFERRGRRLIPTAAGLTLYRSFIQQQTQLCKTISEIEGRRDTVIGTLRIGAYLEFAKSRLTRVLKEFLDEYADANVKIVFDSPSRLHGLLLQGQLDLCFSIFPATDRKAIRSKALLEEELVLVSAPHRISDSPSFEELMRVSMVDYYYNHQPIRKWLALHFDKRPKRLPVRVFAATAEMVAALVREGVGVGILPRYLVEGSAAGPGLRIIRPTARKLVDYIWLLEHAHQEMSPGHAAFRERLLRHFAEL